MEIPPHNFARGLNDMRTQRGSVSSLGGSSGISRPGFGPWYPLRLPLTWRFKALALLLWRYGLESMRSLRTLRSNLAVLPDAAGAASHHLPLGSPRRKPR